MARPRLSAFLATSLDGFIARRDGGIDWLPVPEPGGEDFGYGAFFGSVDAVVLGRATYDTVLGFGGPWPYAGKRVVVLTHHPATSRHGETFHSGSPAEVAGRLASEGVRHAYVDGGAVVSAFLAAGLLDDLTVSIIPIVLGDGIRLFQAPLPERTLVLEEARPHAEKGLVQLRYRVA